MGTRARMAGWAGALAVLLAAGAWYRSSAPDPEPATAGNAPAFGVTAFAAPAAGMPPAAAPQSGREWLSPVPAQAEPLAERLHRLTAGNDPRDAYRAYQLVRACNAVRARPQQARSGQDNDALAHVADPVAYCAAMTERMRMDSVALLERAARAGVDGAMAALVEEGPFGDPNALVTRPGDPLVREWKDRVNHMLAEQAGQGDWASLYLVFTGFMFGNPAIDADRQSALAYGIALRDILVKVDGLTEDEAIPFNAPFLDQVRDGLTREQQDKAIVQAAAIVDTALRHRAGGGRQAPQRTI